MKPQQFGVVAALLVLIALVLLLSSGTPPNSADKAAAPPPRVVMVTGEAEVRAKPDLAQVSVGIWTHGASATDAEALNVAFVKQVQTAMVNAGAESEGVEVTQTALTTASYQDFTGATRISGFESRASIKVLVKNLTKVQAVVDAALAGGATSLESIGYTMENPEQAKEAAMKAALANARVRATVLVKAEGGKLGDLQSMEVLPVDNPPSTPAPASLVFKAQVKAAFQY